jgi:hypothetical protein
MNAYLFSAGCTTMAVGPAPGRGGQTVNTPQIWDGCSSGIVCGGDAEQARKRFEAWVCQPPSAEKPNETTIKKIVAAQLIADLLTESGPQPPDLPELGRQMTDPDKCVPADDFEQGYWVDINQALPPGKISFDVDSLKRDLAEDIRSGLNWSPDKQFLFLVTVLSPLAPPPVPADEPETAVEAGSLEDEAGPDPDADLDVYVTSLPEMRDKETAALVKARNSVVAAWLCRKYAANTRVAANELYISPCCTLIPIE